MPYMTPLNVSGNSGMHLNPKFQGMLGGKNRQTSGHEVSLQDQIFSLERSIKLLESRKDAKGTQGRIQRMKQELVRLRSQQNKNF